MFSFLSAIENVVGQRQNDRWRKKAKQFSWRWRIIIFFVVVVCAVQEICFNYSKTIRFIFLVSL